MIENSVSQLRHIMASITLSRNVKVSPFVLWKPLQPIHQECVVIDGCLCVSAALGIRCCVRVRESDTGRRLQKQQICSFTQRKGIEFTINYILYSSIYLINLGVHVYAYHDSMKMDYCREFSHRLKLGMAPVLALLHRQEMNNQALFIFQELIN